MLEKLDYVNTLMCSVYNSVTKIQCLHISIMGG